MRRAALGSMVFLLVAPGVVAGAIPWALTGWRQQTMPAGLRACGVVLIALGAAFVLHAFARFVVEGRGTPAPIAPTSKLVVGGVYRWVRNPMYLAVGSVIAGQALLLGAPILVGYLVVFFATVMSFVAGYEEPTLRATYGEEYERYCRAVPGWRPRLRPWHAGG